MGHPMIMGRRTFDSIGRALPGRRTIVVTRDRGVGRARRRRWRTRWTRRSSWPLPAIAAPASRRRPVVMVVGGGEIYRQTIDRADRLEITQVDADVVGDTRFPDIDPALWQETDREAADGYAFVSYRAPRAGPRPAGVAVVDGPQLHDGEYLFCTVPAGTAIPAGCHPVATVLEAEGTTLVLPDRRGRAAGLAGEFPLRWITLTVTSALEAVGLTAAVATALTRDGIACNVIAGFHHDHLFVPVERAGSGDGRAGGTRRTPGPDMRRSGVRSVSRPVRPGWVEP